MQKGTFNKRSKKKVIAAVILQGEARSLHYFIIGEREEQLLKRNCCKMLASPRMGVDKFGE